MLNKGREELTFISPTRLPVGGKCEMCCTGLEADFQRVRQIPDVVTMCFEYHVYGPA